MSWLKPKSVKNYTGMESEEPFGNEMPNFHICGTVFKELFEGIDVLDVVAKTETAASSETNRRKSTENEQNKRKRSIVILEDDEIEELQSKQVAKNAAKGTESAVCRLGAWFNDRYGKKLVLASINKTNASDLLKHFFFWKYETQEKIVLERNMNHRSWALIYRNGLRRSILERKDGESFDIGEDEDLKKKPAAKKKQLKAEGKGNRPHRADPLDENQVEKLWTTGAVGLKTPRQLLHLVWWNDTRMLGMRGRPEHLNCKVQDFPRKLLWLHLALDENENRRNGWPKSKTQVQQRDISGKQRWKRSLCCVRKVPQP